MDLNHLNPEIVLLLMFDILRKIPYKLLKEKRVWYIKVREVVKNLG
jgi:hypothetical protein